MGRKFTNKSDLRGMTRGLNRDELSRNNYADNTAKSEQKQFPSCNPFTEQSRATHPAWHFRDLEQNNILSLNEFIYSGGLGFSSRTKNGLISINYAKGNTVGIRKET